VFARGRVVSFSEQISPMIGRWAIAWFFLSAAWDRAQDWGATVQLLAMRGIPAAPALLALAILIMTLGGLSLFLGYQTRHGAMFLFGFTIVVTLLMHDFWNVKNSVDRAADYQLFACNVAVAGGLLLLVGMGPGPFAFDNKAGKKGRR
jgi:putative oxidoreductase